MTYQKRLPATDKQFHPKVTGIGTKSGVPFPPEPFSKGHVVEVVNQLCVAIDSLYVETVGCKVCGMLVARHKAVLADKLKSTGVYFQNQAVRLHAGLMEMLSSPLKKQVDPLQRIPDNMSAWYVLNFWKGIRSHYIPWPMETGWVL